MRHKKGVDVQSDDSKQVDTESESTFRVFDMGRWKVKLEQNFTILKVQIFFRRQRSVLVVGDSSPGGRSGRGAGAR